MPECEEAYTNREEKEETEMKVLKKITDFVSRYMAAIVILMALVALFAPSTVSFIKTLPRSNRDSIRRACVYF